MQPFSSHFQALFAQETAPDAPTLLGVVGVPGAVALVGFVLFAVLFQASLTKKKNLPLRHVGTVLILVALMLSLRTLFKLSDAETGKFYAAAIIRSYTLYAHYAMPAFLGLVLVGIGIAEGYLNKALPGAR